MLEVDDILPSPLTPLELASTVPNKFAKRKHPPSSPQPQSVDTANFARVNPLLSPATSSSSSGELHLYIDSDTSSPSVPTGLQSSSQELLVQGTIQVPQSPPLVSIAHTAASTAQPPIQPTNIPSWANEVATVRPQSGHCTPETVVPNWAYSGMIRGARARSQPLGYPPPVASDASTAYTTPAGTLTEVRPGSTTTKASTIFPKPTPYDRRTSTDNYRCSDPSPRRRPRATAHEIYPVRSSSIQISQSPARHTASSSRGPQPSSSRGLSLSHQHTAFHKSHKDQISDSTSLQTLSALIPSRVYMCQRESVLPPPRLSTR